MSSAVASAKQMQKNCHRCQQPASKHCSKCQKVWYCSVDCQRQDWKQHKSFCQQEYQMSQYELHKKAFDAIVEKYNLKTEEKSTQIAEILTSGENAITAPAFAEKFGMDIQEAVVFLEWVKVGVKFKEQTADIANRTGFKQGKR